MSTLTPKNTICLWYNKDALEAAQFYAATFPDSKVTAVRHAPSDFPRATREMCSRWNLPCSASRAWA